MDAGRSCPELAVERGMVTVGRVFDKLGKERSNEWTDCLLPALLVRTPLTSSRGGMLIGWGHESRQKHRVQKRHIRGEPFPELYEWRKQSAISAAYPFCCTESIVVCVVVPSPPGVVTATPSCRESDNFKVMPVSTPFPWKVTGMPNRGESWFPMLSASHLHFSMTLHLQSSLR